MFNGKVKSCNGYIFKYTDDAISEKPVHKGKLVTINGITYQSLKHASTALGITVYKIKNCYVKIIEIRSILLCSM